MVPSVSETTDTVVVGNGPSALILSYILHGHIPYYAGGHPDNLLDLKLTQSPNLLHVNPDLYVPLRDSLKYSSQGLLVNNLLDTLLRPHGDGDSGSTSCVRWQLDPKSKTDHIVLGSAKRAGGQWANNPVHVALDIGTLSYAEQLSLPAYTFANHWLATKGKEMPELLRPSRSDVADYFAAYPKAAGISDSIRSSSEVVSVTRVQDGFHIAPQNIQCRHLVLATGTFSINQPPPPFLRPLLDLPEATDGTLLIVGSGLTAADIIISTPPSRKIIHIYNWDPEHHPSPLQSCHHEAYPEYAGVYRQMKRSALAMVNPFALQKAEKRKKASTSQIPNFADRNWGLTYEGIANARILFVDEASNKDAKSQQQSPLVTVHIGRTPEGQVIKRQISTIRYATGRRGSLSYLSKPLLKEVLPRGKSLVYDLPPQDFGLTSEGMSTSSNRRTSTEYDFGDVPNPTLISGRTLREKIEESPSGMEVANGVFVIGSLTGDSLVRLAFGSCTAVAGRLMAGTSVVVNRSEDEIQATALAKAPITNAPDSLVANTAKPQSFSPSLTPIMSAPDGDNEPGNISLQRPIEESTSMRSPKIVNGTSPTQAQISSQAGADSQGRKGSKIMQKKKGRCIVS